jgi:hypothetical protein
LCFSLNRFKITTVIKHLIPTGCGATAQVGFEGFTSSARSNRRKVKIALGVRVIQLSENPFLLPKPRTRLAGSTTSQASFGFALAFTLAILLQPIPAQGGLDATVDLSNPRIVPIYVSNTGLVPAGRVNSDWSGFLYSSRIVFSAAHSEVGFDNNGNRINYPRPTIVVGKPNTRAGDGTGAVRVVKSILAKNYRSGLLDDFAIYILEKDLVEMTPVKLLTPEIEKELLATKLPIKMHGYGEYGDRCGPDQKPPCDNALPTELPRTLTATLSTLADIEKIVGYNRPQFAGHLTIFNGKQGFGCPGDSGGSVTAVYKNELTYLGPTPNGSNVYACGVGAGYDGKGGIWYTSPVYKHLDMIKEAEDFVIEMRAKEAKEAEQIKADRERAAPAVAVKKPKVLVCKKGLVKKRITSAPFKCPKGFTK